MEKLRHWGRTVLGFIVIATGALLYLYNYLLGTSILLVLGVGLLLFDRNHTKRTAEGLRLKEILSWAGIIFAAVLLALLIKKDIDYGGFFNKPAKPSIYTLLYDEIA